jgi:hypothetical protein
MFICLKKEHSWLHVEGCFCAVRFRLDRAWTWAFGMAFNVDITTSEVPLKAQSILALLENISHILRACICKLFNWVDLKAAKPTYILPKVAKPLLTLKLRKNSCWCYWDNNTSLLEDSIVTKLIHNTMRLNVNYLFWKTLNPQSEQ